MICSPRLQKILQIFIESNDYVSVSKLSSLLQASKRTIFRELQDIDYILEPFSLKLVSKPKKGFYLEGKEADKTALSQTLLLKKREYLSKEERQKMLIVAILKEHQVQKLYYYADLFQVSEATISNDLDYVQTWFETYDLHLERLPGVGIELVGDEQSYRQALTAALSNSIYNTYQNTYLFQDSDTVLETLFMESEDGILGLLNQDILKKILAIFHLHEAELELRKYAQSSYMGLMIHLTIAIDRILKKEALEDNDFVVAMMLHDDSYKQAKKMVRYLEAGFPIHIPEVEIAFIAMHIKGAKVVHNVVDAEAVELSKYRDEELYQLSMQMIDTLPVSDAMVLKEDKELLQGMIAHLRPTLVRLHHHMPIYNPLLEQIKASYQDIYELARVACSCIYEQYGYVVPEGEIAYIAMHIGAAIERSKHGKVIARDLFVGIVCSSGIGVSAMLLARLAKVCDDFVHFETLAVEDVKQGKADCDILISTFMFDSEEEVILVNPLLEAEDVQRVQDVIYRKRRSHNHHKQIKKETSAIAQVADDVMEVLESFEVILCEKVMDEEKLFRKVVSKVGEDEEAKQSLYDKLMQREHLNSMFFEDMGFALLHGFGGKGCSLKLYRLPYGCKHKVNIAFALGMFLPLRHTKSQQQMMSSISRSMMEDETLYQVLKTGEYKEVYGYIEKLMKDFLFQWVQEKRND